MHADLHGCITGSNCSVGAVATPHGTACTEMHVTPVHPGKGMLCMPCVNKVLGPLSHKQSDLGLPVQLFKTMCWFPPLPFAFQKYMFGDSKEVSSKEKHADFFFTCR